MAALEVAVLVLACHDEQLTPVTAQQTDSVVYLTVSTSHPAVGSTITVTANVAPRVGLNPVGSFKARLQYDPTGLTFLQESRLPTGLRALNPQQGHVIVAGAAAEGFTDGRLFAVTFRAQRPAALASLELEIVELNGTDFADQRPAVRGSSLRVLGTRP